VYTPHMPHLIQLHVCLAALVPMNPSLTHSMPCMYDLLHCLESLAGVLGALSLLCFLLCLVLCLVHVSFVSMCGV
jgi:hypothetical protein